MHAPVTNAAPKCRAQQAVSIRDLLLVWESKGFAMTMKVELVVFLLLVSADAGEHGLFRGVEGCSHCSVVGCDVRCDVR